MDNNEKEKDIYIKYNLSKHKEVPEKIDNLFNNFVKEVEKMDKKEENNVEKEEGKFETKEKKVKNNRIVFRRVLGFVACVTIAFAGANIYATSQGYDNIFFLIKHVAEGGKITDKNEILSDRDITISYNSIDIGKGIKLQVNKITVKDNEAKLFLVVDTSKATEKITELKYKVKSDNTEMCSETQTNNIVTKFEKELVLDNFKDDTKVLTLNIIANNLELSTIKINLETKEIEVDGEKELEKISEIELKQYLSAFALLDYPEGHGGVDSYIDNQYSLLVGATLKREMFNTTNTAELSRFDVDEMNEIVKSFTDIKIENGLINVGNGLFKITNENGKSYYEFTQLDGIPTAICLSVDNITYENGIYTADFTYCYPTVDDYEKDNIENIERYSNTIKLKLNTDSEYSKYYIESLGVKKVAKEAEKNETENTADNNQAPTPTSAPAPTANPATDTSKIDNYTTSMTWGQYRSAGLKVTYPTDFTITETSNPNKGNSPGELYATMTGTAIGKENGEITRSDMTIEFYEPEAYTKEQLDYLENQKTAGTFTSYNTGKTWYRIGYTPATEKSPYYCEEFVSRVGLNREDGSDVVVKVVFKYSIPSYKVTNIMNYMLGELRSASY